MSHSPPEASHSPPEASHPPPEASHSPPEVSHPPPEASRSLPEASHSPPEASHLPPEASHSPPEASHSLPEAIAPESVFIDSKERPGRRSPEADGPSRETRGSGDQGRTASCPPRSAINHIAGRFTQV